MQVITHAIREHDDKVALSWAVVSHSPKREERSFFHPEVLPLRTQFICFCMFLSNPVQTLWSILLSFQASYLNLIQLFIAHVLSLGVNQLTIVKAVKNFWRSLIGAIALFTTRRKQWVRPQAFPRSPRHPDQPHYEIRGGLYVVSKSCFFKVPWNGPNSVPFWRPKSLWRDFMTLPYKGSSSVGFDPNHCLTDGDCEALTWDQRNSGSQETLQPRTENQWPSIIDDPSTKKMIKKGVLVCNVNVLNLDIFGLHLGPPQSQALSHSSLGKRCASFWAPKVEIKNRDDRFDKGSNDKGSNTAVGQNLGYLFGDGKTKWIFSTFKDYVPW